MSRRRAFTLIELLVVVSVIAVLIAILLPSLGRAKKRARAVICSSNERSMTLTMRMYVQDWGKTFLGGGHGGPLGVWDFQLFGGGLSKTAYYANNGRRDSTDKVRFCPETPAAAKTVVGSSETQWNCEQGTGALNSTGSYGFNGWLYDPNDKSASGIAGPNWTVTNVYKITQVKNESVVPAFVDSNWHDFWASPTDTAPASLTAPGSTNVSSGNNSLQRACMDRHSLAVEVSFVDGHVENVKLPNLWTLNWSTAWTRNTPQKVQ